MIHSQHYNIYISSCNKDGGIYHYRLLQNGSIDYAGFTAVDRPMYTVISDNKMYVLMRAPFENNSDSGLVVYDIDKDGKLTNPTAITSTKGKVACHLCVDKENVYCVNYTSGNIIKMPDLTIQHVGNGVNADRQEGPHPHFAGMTPDNKYVLIADLGLDAIMMYDKELNLISTHAVPCGHGARHLAFSGNYLYCANELESTLSVFKYCNDTLEYKNTVSALPADFAGESTASAIRIRDNFCYVANRGHDSISVINIAEEIPRLITTVPCSGNSPRDFNIINDILVCANEESDNVTFFKIVNGIPQKLAEELKIKSAFCIAY